MADAAAAHDGADDMCAYAHIGRCNADRPPEVACSVCSHKIHHCCQGDYLGARSLPVNSKEYYCPNCVDNELRKASGSTSSGSASTSSRSASPDLPSAPAPPDARPSQIPPKDLYHIGKLEEEQRRRANAAAAEAAATADSSSSSSWATMSDYQKRREVLEYVSSHVPPAGCVTKERTFDEIRQELCKERDASDLERILEELCDKDYLLSEATGFEKNDCKYLLMPEDNVDGIDEGDGNNMRNNSENDDEEDTDAVMASMEEAAMDN